MTYTSAFPLPATGDGSLHVAEALQLYPRPPDQAAANLVAGRCDLVSLNLGDMSGYEAGVASVNPDVILAPYDKGRARTASSVPTCALEGWYEHDSTGARVVKGASGAGNPQVYIFEPSTVTAQRTCQDDLMAITGGNPATGKSWRTWQVSGAVEFLRAKNAPLPAASRMYRGWFNDSEGLFQFVGNPINPATGQPYTAAQWLDATWAVNRAGRTYSGTITPESMAAINTERFCVIGNGLSPYRSAGTPSAEQGICQSVDVAMVEGVLYTGGPAASPSQQAIENVLNMMIDGQRYSYVWLLEKPWGGSGWNTAAWNRARRVSAAVALLGDRGRTLWTFGRAQNTSASSINPAGLYPYPNPQSSDQGEYAQDAALYALALGAPLPADSPVFSATQPNPGAAMRLANGVYSRRFASGRVLVNPATSGKPVVVDQACKLYDAATTFAVGASVTVPANDAVFLVATAGPADTTSPVVDWQRPTGDGSVPTTQTTQRVFGTITDAGSGPDYVSVNDARVSPDATGYWETLVTLAAAGVGTPITVYGVDVAGNQTTPATRTITRAGDAAGPAFASVTPSQTIPNAQTSITISGVVSDPSGVASLTINGTAVTVAGDGSFSRTLTGLAVGDTTVTLVATDAAANTTTLTRTITRSADTTAPVFAGVPADATVPHSTATQTISGFVSDPEGDAVTLAIGGIPVSVNAATGAFSLIVALSVGANTYQLVATDPAGNTATITRTYTRQAASGDSTPPSFSGVTQDQSVANTQDSITISGRVADASGVASLTANGVSVPVTAGAFGYRQSLVVGVNRVTLRATDTVGNIETTTVTITRRATSDVGGGATLGCGSYEVSLWTRGRTRRIGVFEDWTTLEYHRRRGATSDATVTFDAAAVARCCGLIGSVERYEHELVITRSVSSSEDVWEGPVVDWEVTDGAAKIVANDVSRWLSGRDVSHDHDAVEQDAAELAAALVVDAMSRDRSPGVDVSWLPSGVLVTRKVLAGQHLIAADVLADLANLGLSWTTRERTILLGGAAVGVAAVALLDDEALVSRPRVAPSADSASVIGVRGAGGGGDAADPVYAEAADAAAVARLGRYVSVVSDDTAATNAQAAAAAARLVSSSANPAVALDALGVAQDAPVTLDLLIPGVLVALSLDGCRPVVGAWRVESVSVSAAAGAESVSVEVDAP